MAEPPVTGPDPPLAERPEPIPPPLNEAAAEPARDTAERRLDPRVLHLWRADILLRAVLTTAAVLILAGAVPGGAAWSAVAAAPVALGIALVLAWPPARYRRWRFRTRERDLYIRYGVVWRTVSVVPYSRIQHVDTRHGPLERWLGLARLVVYTAGVRGADVTIPGLAADEAEALREQLAAVGGSEDAV
jgi:uncharacterized protein